MPLVLLTALGAVLRFIGIAHQGFWYDESYTALLVHLTPGHMLRLLPQLESTPPVYYCVAWVWAHVFGDDPAGLKSLSAVCGVLTIPLVYGATRRLLADRRTAVIAAALTAFNPLLIWYSQEARAYALLVLLCAATLFAFARVLDRPERQWLIAWALSSALALGTHYYAALIVIPEATSLLYKHRRIRAVWVSLAGVAAVGAALLPLLLTQSATGNDAWIAATPLRRRLAQIPALFLIGPQTHLRDLVKYVAFAAALVGLLSAAVQIRKHRLRRGPVALGLTLAGFLVATTVGESTLLARNLLPLWAPFAAFLAAGLSARSSARRVRRAGLLATLALCVVGAFATVSVATDYWLERPNWQVLARALGSWPRPPGARRAARVIVVQRNPGAMPLALYLHGLRYAHADQLPDVRVLDVIAIRRKRGLGKFCWWGSACNLVPSRLPQRYHLVGFHRVRIVHVEQFNVLELEASTPRTLNVGSLPLRRAGKRGHPVVEGRAAPVGLPLIQPG